MIRNKLFCVEICKVGFARTLIRFYRTMGTRGYRKVTKTSRRRLSKHFEKRDRVIAVRPTDNSIHITLWPRMNPALYGE